MALNTSKSSHLMPLHFKGLKQGLNRNVLQLTLEYFIFSYRTIVVVGQQSLFLNRAAWCTYCDFVVEHIVQYSSNDTVNDSTNNICI